MHKILTGTQKHQTPSAVSSLRASLAQDWVIQFGKSCTVNRDWPTQGSELVLTRIEAAAGAPEYQPGVRGGRMCNGHVFML